MRTNIIEIITVVLVGMTFACMADSAEAAITDVHLLTEEPTMNDVITIVTSGVESCSPVFITDSVFHAEETALELNIFLFVGPYTVVTPWSHSQDIGTLPAGLYELTVRTFEVPNITDTYSMTFEVVPEPTTVLLLALGVIGIRVIKRTPQALTLN